MISFSRVNLQLCIIDNCLPNESIDQVDHCYICLEMIHWQTEISGWNEAGPGGKVEPCQRLEWIQFVERLSRVAGRSNKKVAESGAKER